MKKSNKRILILAVVLSLCVGAIIGAGAISTLVDIKAQLNYGITVEYNGEAKTLTDATGNTTVPITYKGTTYLPIRSISNLLSIPVNWEGATQTIQLGDTGDGVDMIEVCYPYYKSDSTAHVRTADNNKEQPMGINHISHWIYMPIHSTASYDLGGRYSTLTFKYMVKHTNYYFGVLEILGDDGTVLSTIDTDNNEIVKTVKVDLRKTNDLTFKFNTKDNYRAYLTMFDMRLE